MTNWLTAQSQEPAHMYVRPCVKIEDPTHPWTMTESLDFFYSTTGAQIIQESQPCRKAPESDPDVSHLHRGKTTTL
jgi:hypothetical protein